MENRPTPTSNTLNLKDAICSFGRPSDQVVNLQGYVHAANVDNKCRAMRSTHQYSTDAGATGQCSTGACPNDRAGPSSQSDNSDSEAEVDHYVARRTPMTSSTPRLIVPSQDINKIMGCFLSCAQDSHVTIAGDQLTQEGHRHVPRQRIVHSYRHPPVPCTVLPDSTKPITTLVIQNIPPHCTTLMLIDELKSRGFQGVYSFLYHPVDRRTRNHQPFAFVDFATTLIAKAFFSCFHGAFLQCSRGGETPLTICAAKEQGATANSTRFHTCKSANRGRFRARPLFFSVDDTQVLKFGAIAGFNEHACQYH